MFPYLARFAGFFSSFQQMASTVGSGDEGVYVPVTWYEKAIDALHRMIRPTVVYSVIILCMFGWYDPDRLLKFAKALYALPELYWYGYLIVILTVAAPKMINSIRNNNGSAPSDAGVLGAHVAPLGTIVPPGVSPPGTPGITTKTTEIKTETVVTPNQPVSPDGAGPSPMPPPPGTVA